MLFYVGVGIYIIILNFFSGFIDFIGLWLFYVFNVYKKN